jgi:hypothetical protein
MTDQYSSSEALRLAQMLRDVVDTLIPGEGDWPAASLVGVHGVLGARLVEMLGENALVDVDLAIRKHGGPLAALDSAGRVNSLRQLESAEPKLFALLRTASYLAYYENPAVIVQIRSLGQPYDAVPIRRGYDIGQFDLERDRPRHNRGHFVSTPDVQRVDLSKLT